MITADQAYAAFRDANPAPVVEVELLPSPLEALRTAQGAPTPLAPPEPPLRPFRVGVLTAAAVFVLVIVVGALTFFAGRSADDEFVDEPEVTTTLPQQTTTVAPTTVAPTTAPPVATPVITPETQALLDQFATAYGGDFDTFATLLDPELQLEIRIEQDPPVVWGLAEIAEQFGFYEALNTDLGLGSCTALDAETVSCVLLRTDDLVRVHGLEPATDVRITLRFTDGLVTSWTERPAKGDDYQSFAVAPFANWLRETYPEVPNPKVLGGAPWWTPTGDIVDQLPALVDEYATGLGVNLDG